MRITAALLLVLALPALPARGFVCLKAGSTCLHWSPAQANLVSFLGSPGAPLMNGTTTWDQNAVNAANDWSGAGSAFHFNANPGGLLNEPCGTGPGHACPGTGPAGDNPVLFRSDVCGVAYGPDIIELTKNCWNADGTMVNAPVFVNSGVLWNAYDGPIQFTNSGQPINDIRRVLLHEFGHVLGLGHPDEAGQTVQAIMNSMESNLDRLQADDVAGLRFLYPMNPTVGSSGGCQMEGGSTSANWILSIPALLLAWSRRRSCRHSQPAHLTRGSQQHPQV